MSGQERRRRSKLTTCAVAVVTLLAGCFDWDREPQITVTSPNGGETWVPGTPVMVTWSSAGVAGDVMIELSTDGGATWRILVETTPDDGSEEIVVPYAPGAECVLRVSAGDGSISDQSDAAFIIASPETPGLAVKSPNGGETWVVGTTGLVTWKSTGGPFKIELSTDGGVNWPTLVEETLGNPEFYGFQVGSERYCGVTIPDTVSDHCVIRVGQVDGDLSDASNAEFTIAPAGTPVINLISPNGGEIWYHGGHPRPIVWYPWGFSGEVEIYYSTDSGATYQHLVDTEGYSVGYGTCFYSWSIPDEDSAHCRVRVQVKGNEGLSDESDADFTIVPSPFTPVEGVLPAARAYAMAWGDYDSDGDLDLALAGYGGGLYVSKLYRNDGGGSFSDSGFVMPEGLTAFEWGDFDGDGNLDIVAAGSYYDGTEWVPIRKYYRNEGGTFSEADVGLSGESGPRACGDYDNDGDLDIVVWAPEALKIVWNESGIFGGDATVFALVQDVGWGLPACGDYDNDGDLDFAVAGAVWHSDPPDSAGSVYRNDGAAFDAVDTGLKAVYDCWLAWGDYDSDGDLDLAQCGRVGEGWPVIYIYRNTAGSLQDIGAFPERDHGGGHLTWADFDCDGDLDLTIGTEFFRNDGGWYFTDIRVSPPDMSNDCLLAWADYDNDGDLDMAIAGQAAFEDPVARLYRNDGALPNTPPAAPTGLSAEVASGIVTFSWDPATDAQTPSSGLTYNLRVGTAHGGNDVMPGMSIVDPGGEMDGRRLVPDMGNCQHGMRLDGGRIGWWLSLPPGTHYWSVQAVDTSFAGSLWAEEQEVAIP